MVAALRANDTDTFKRWLSGGVQDLGEPVVEELLLVERLNNRMSNESVLERVQRMRDEAIRKEG